MSSKTIVATLLAIAMLPSSGTLAQQSAPGAAAGADTGTVVFFRLKKFAGAAVGYKVREGDVELCRLRNASYCILQVASGKHEYTVHSEAKDILTLEVDPGETYHVVGGITVGVLAGRPNLSPSDAAAFEAVKGELKDVTGQGLDKD
jgi:hypothetical protein